MEFDPDIHHRRSVRLRGYNYSRPGTYFLTLCTHEKRHFFGEIVERKMQFNALGEAARQEWLASGRLRAEIELDDFVVMPNHVHGLVRIVGADGVRPGFAKGAEQRSEVGAHGRAPLPARGPRSLPSFVAGFKAAATGAINRIRGTPGAVVWQRNYYEHIVRNPRELAFIRDYIGTNPARWDTDPLAM